eukprot:530550_1
MADLDIVSVLVTISDTIIYYKQCIDLTQMHQRIPLTKEHQLRLDSGYTLLNIINNRLSSDESRPTSSVHMYIHNIPLAGCTVLHDIYNLCCNTQYPFTVSILIKYRSAGNADLEDKISPILQSIQYHIHKCFTSSKQIPIYILRIRCHTLIHKALISYKRNQCCGSKAKAEHDMTRVQLEMAIYHKPDAHR